MRNSNAIIEKGAARIAAKKNEEDSDSDEDESASALEKIEVGREHLSVLIKEKASPELKELGNSIGMGAMVFVGFSMVVDC